MLREPERRTISFKTGAQLNGGQNMSILDSIIEPYLTKSESGETIFYPWGIWGKGYEVSSESQIKKIRSTLKAFSVCLFFLVLVAFQSVSGLYVEFLAVTGFVTYWAWAKSVTRGLPVFSERISFRDRIQNSIMQDNQFKLLIITSILLFLSVMSALMFYMEPVDRLMASFFFLLFASLTVLCVYILIMKQKTKDR